MAVHLQPAHPRLDAPRVDLDLVVHREAPRGERARHDGAESPDREDAVDRQARRLIRDPWPAPRAPARRARPAARRAPRPSSPRPARSGQPARKVPRERAPHVVAHQLDPVGLGEIGLGQDHEPRLDAQELSRSRGARASAASPPRRPRRPAAPRSMPPAPASMFLTKRSWPGTSTISIASPSASSRKAKPRSMVMPRAFSSGSRSVSVPVSALHQRRLAVVDVPGGADDDVPHASAVRTARQHRDLGSPGRAAVEAAAGRRRAGRGPGAAEAQRLVEPLGRARRACRGRGPRSAARRWERAAADLGAASTIAAPRARAASARSRAEQPARARADRRERLGQHASVGMVCERGRPPRRRRAWPRARPP